MKFDNKYFVTFSFTEEQIAKNFSNAFRDFDIARRDKIREVKFNYSYTAFLKAGIALLSLYQIRAKGQPGHHIKIIEKMAEILGDESIADIGNTMRVKRNSDLYLGGVEITEKECRECMEFVDKVLLQVKKAIARGKKGGQLP